MNALNDVLSNCRPKSKKNYKSRQRFCKKIDFKGIKFPVKIRDIRKIERKNLISISVFSYENKEKYPMQVLKKCFEKKYVDLLFIGEEGKRHFAFIKVFNRFMYGQTLHCGRKHFCCLQAFSTK